MSQPKFEQLAFHEYSTDEMRQRAVAFHRELSRRRTVRDFSDRRVPYAIIKEGVRTAGTAPSGANLQPWHFAVVSNLELKARIRQAAEKE